MISLIRTQFINNVSHSPLPWLSGGGGNNYYTDVGDNAAWVQGFLFYTGQGSLVGYGAKLHLVPLGAALTHQTDFIFTLALLRAGLSPQTKMFTN